MKTQKVTLFEDVTTGVDVLYSIPAASLQHTGTYQCEIISDARSIVRLYFYLTGNNSPTPDMLLYFISSFTCSLMCSLSLSQ